MFAFLQKSFRITNLGILIFSLLAFPVCVYMFGSRYPDQFSFEYVICFPLGLLWCYLLYRIWRWLLPKPVGTVIAVCSGLALACYLIVLLTFDTQPASDYLMVWKSALDMAQDNYDANLLKGYDYMAVYNWQIGMAVFESGIIRLFGPEFTVLKVLNVLFLLAIGYLVYDLTRKKVNEPAARASYLLCAGFIPYIMTAPQLSNHHTGTVFLLLALKFSDGKNWKHAILAGLFAAIWNVFRAIAIVYLIAVIVMGVYYLFRSKNYVITLRQLALNVGTFAIVTVLVSWLFMKANLAAGPLYATNVPYFKFHRGLIGYNETFQDLRKRNGDLEAFNAWEKQLVTDALHQPVKTSVYVLNKMVRYLGSWDGQYEHTYNHDASIFTRPVVKVFYSMGWMQYVAVLFFGFFGYRRWIISRKLTTMEVWFAGNTLVYLLIEATTHYRFEHYPFLFLMAGAGVAYRFLPEQANQ